MVYTPTTWVNNSAPSINATNLNKIEQGIAAVSAAAVNVKDYGAAGDDTTDDTTAIQNTLSAGAGKTVYLPDGTYKITSALTIPANTRLVGSGTIHQTTTGAKGLVIGGSNVTIEGLTLKGRLSAAAYASGEYAIDLVAPNLAGSYTGIVIRGVTITMWGYAGISLRFADGFRIVDCDVSTVGYTGIQVLSGANGLIRGNRVQNIGPGSSGNMYGIALSYSGTESASDPSTRDTVVDGNLISGVAWEGLETHGGLRITFSNNTILGCKTGIAFAQASVTAITGGVVTGNVVDTLNDTGDGSAYALQVYGRVSGSTITAAATVTISNNVFRRCGPAQVVGTRGLILTDNVFQESYGFAVFVGVANEKMTIAGNSFIDVWSDTESGYGIIVASTAHNSGGIVVNNQLVRGAKSATWVNYCGIYVHESATSTSWKVGWNGFAGASCNQYAGTYTPATLPT